MSNWISRAAYGWAARSYDVASGEPIYRAGREAGVPMLGLRHGETVLDLGCGTGLNFPLLREAVGPRGRVIGVDRSPQMLDTARRRIARASWQNVELVHADATQVDANDVGAETIDAVLATYAMSLFDDPGAAWSSMRDLLRPAGRACIVDMALPTGAAAILAPLARLACAAGGADIHSHPWRLVEADGVDVARRALRGGHVRVVAATIP